VRFRDRSDAGRQLAGRLAHLVAERPVIVALPRGGVPVGAEIARALNAPLDVILVRKVGAPDRPELAAGALGEDGVTVRNVAVLHQLGLSWDDLSEEVDAQWAQLRSRQQEIRSDRPRVDLRDRTVVIVDDGIATGSTVVAAMRVVRAMDARRVVLAVPVAPPETVESMEILADEVMCLQVPERFHAVGQWFKDFSQVSDEEVRDLLRSVDQHG
jgi:putative phosphoribosyl transferase